MLEGIIKYNTSKQVKKTVVNLRDFRTLEKYRRKLNHLNLIEYSLMNTVYSD